MGKKTKQTDWQRRFSEGFTGKKIEIKRPKRRRRETQAEAIERRRKMNAKYDQNGNLR